MRRLTADMITYRKANIDDCLSIETLKGIVWNTTYFLKSTTYRKSVEFCPEPAIL